jgi:hypothetical protein
MADLKVLAHPGSVNRSQMREANSNWRGGRSVASNGYVIVRVGVDHHLADVRGYAYEHRLVAEQKAGRRLRPGEQIHHINGNKQDNRPENIVIVSGIAEHRVHHRKKQVGLRLPGEANPMICCGCGCGDSLLKFDESGRPRRYISGHNDHESPSQDAVLAAFGEVAVTIRELQQVTGLSLNCVKGCLTKLRKRGCAERIGYGVWRKVAAPEEAHAL